MSGLAERLVAALARIYDAPDLVPIASTQVAGVSYRNLGAAGLDFLRDWAAQGERVCVPSTLNPAGMDLEDWCAHGIPPDFAAQQLAVIDAYRAFGVEPTCTCTPYLVGNRPRLGEHVAWSESSAVAFANSILGARSNREGGPAALAAAILGRTARYGLHLDEGRRATVVVDVTCPLGSCADWAALGYLAGRLAGDGVPLLRLHQPPPRLREAGQRGSLHGGMESVPPEGPSIQPAIPTAPDLASSPFLPHLKALGAAMAASGAVGLFHIDGVTPEARDGRDVRAANAQPATIASLDEAYRDLNTGGEAVDLVSLGCPHAALTELEAIAQALQGRQARTSVWVTTARATLREAERSGVAQALAASGVRLLADTCLVVAPMQHYGLRTVATDSAKMALYAPAHCGLQTHFGPLDRCLEAALTGRWPE